MGRLGDGKTYETAGLVWLGGKHCVGGASSHFDITHFGLCPLQSPKCVPLSRFCDLERIEYGAQRNTQAT